MRGWALGRAAGGSKRVDLLGFSREVFFIFRKWVLRFAHSDAQRLM